MTKKASLISLPLHEDASLLALAVGFFPGGRCVLIRIVSPKLRFGGVLFVVPKAV